MNRKLSTLVSTLALTLALPASALAFSSGPVGNNGLRAYPGPNKGDMTLEWQRYSLNGESYTINYGNQSGVYPYSAQKVGYIATYTIHNLVPGQRYFFGLQPIWTGGNTQSISGEVSAVAPSMSTAVIGTKGPIGRNFLTATTGPTSGQVTLTWNRYFTDTTAYSVVYGEMPGVYTYGAVNAVNVNSDQDQHFTYTVGALKSGKRYYFALIPSRSSTQGGVYTTAEVSTVAK